MFLYWSEINYHFQNHTRLQDIGAQLKDTLKSLNDISEDPDESCDVRKRIILFCRFDWLDIFQGMKKYFHFISLKRGGFL